VQLFKRLFGAGQKEECKGSESHSQRIPERVLELNNLMPASAWNKQMGMIETIQTTAKEGKRLVTNREFDDDSKSITNGNGTTIFRTGTLVIFEEGGRAFRDRLEYVGGIFGSETISVQIPEKYRGRNGCLVAIHPYFSIIGNGNGINYVDMDESHLHLISQFAVRSGTFSKEMVFGLPVEGESGKEKIFHHMKQCAFIGLVVRSRKNLKTVYTSELPDAFDPSFRQIGALVKPIITIENYVEHVISLMKNGASEQMREFVMGWAKEDERLASGIQDAGIAF